MSMYDKIHYNKKNYNNFKKRKNLKKRKEKKKKKEFHVPYFKECESLLKNSFWH